jgi:hypothetical protein
MRVDTDPARYWETIYRSKAPTELSWYQPEARLSLDLIRRVAIDLDTPIIDVGGCMPSLARASDCWIVCRRTIARPAASRRFTYCLCRVEDKVAY